MELQIQDLVSSIKKDGIDSANQQAAAILADARKQADAIIADAKSQADKLRDDAKAEIEVFKNSAQLSAQQAKRDAVAGIPAGKFQREFEKILAPTWARLWMNRLADYPGRPSGAGRFPLHRGGRAGDGRHPAGALATRR